jgi:hypothetical protein
LRLDDATGPNALSANPRSLHRAIHDTSHRLQVRQKFPGVDTGDFPPDASEVFRLPAIRQLASKIDRFFAQVTLHGHEGISSHHGIKPSQLL